MNTLMPILFALALMAVLPMTSEGGQEKPNATLATQSPDFSS